MKNSSTAQVDQTDLRILRELQANGRISFSELAERVHLSTTPCWRRVRELEKAGIITGYSCQIDAEKVGLGIDAFVHVTLREHADFAARAFTEALAKIPEVTHCISLAGQFDALLRVQVPDLATYERVLMHKIITVPHIGQMSSCFRLRTLVDRQSLPI